MLLSKYAFIIAMNKIFFTVVNVLKFLTLYSFGSQIKCQLSGLKFTKCLTLSDKRTGQILIRLQSDVVRLHSDVGLCCLPATNVGIFEHHLYPK